jgi:uncharacterized protein
MEATCRLAHQDSDLAEVLIATTWDCNLKCTYCFVRQNDLMADGCCMSPGLAGRVVDALDEGLPHVKTICLHLYGGEPLTNLPALRTLVKRAGKKTPGRFTFAITTNGTINSPEVLECLDENDFQVVLSIDGPAEIHDECRRTKAGAPTHAKVINFLNDLHAKTRCWVRGSSVVRRGWSLAQADAYLRSLPVNAIKAQAVRLSAGAPFGLNEIEKQAYIADLEMAGRRVISDLEAGHPPLDDRFSSRVLQMLQGTARRSFCGAGETVFGITPDGYVLPCVLIDPRKTRLGHISDRPSVWIDAGQRWRNRRPLRSQCRQCPAFPLCGGGCPALLPVCGDDECDLIRKNCEIAVEIYEHFRSNPTALLALAGIT